MWAMYRNCTTSKPIWMGFEEGKRFTQILANAAHGHLSITVVGGDELRDAPIGSNPANAISLNRMTVNISLYCFKA